MLIHKEPIKTYYRSDIFGGHNINNNTKEMNKALINYNNKEISREEILQIYNDFINDFDKFSKAMNKKKLGATSPNQEELLNYGKKNKRNYRKIF